MCQVYLKSVIQTWNFKKQNLLFKKDYRNGHSCPFQPYLASPSTYCVVETVAIKQLFQRMSLTLMRGNAALVMTRKPDSDLAPAEVDGII